MCGELTDIAPDTERPFQLDHKVPLFKGGEDTDENCQVLCSAKGKSCHDKKTAIDMAHRIKQQIGPDGWPVEG